MWKVWRGFNSQSMLFRMSALVSITYVPKYLLTYLLKCKRVAICIAQLLTDHEPNFRQINICNS